jgi:diguanylate cyclase
LKKKHRSEEPCNHCKKLLRKQRTRIKELEELLEAERLRSGTDALTELPNRGSYDRAVVREYALAVRSGKHLAIAVLDLDHFKQVNDQFGHDVGDRILKMFAEILKTQRRASDFVARYGGEEFVIIFPNTNAYGAINFLERLRNSVEDSLCIQVSDKKVCVTVSIGVTQLIEGDTAESLFIRADNALYVAKNTGRNRVTPG